MTRRITGALLIASLALFLMTVSASGASGATIKWSYKGVTLKQGINDLDCPTAKFCVAAGYNAVSVTSDPTGSAKRWKTSYIDRTTDPSGNPSDLTAVACASATLCVTGDDSQNGWFATKPSSGSWTPFAFPSDTYVTVEGIGCSPLGNCTALSVDGREMSNSHPATGGTWSFVSLPHTNPNDVSGSAPAQISCPNKTCVIAWEDGGVWVGQADKFTWVPIKGANDVTEVDCPTSSFCIAGEEDGSGAGIWISHDPTNASSWKPVASKAGHPSAVACPGTGLCLAVAGANTYSSTNPTSATSWKPDAGSAFKGAGFALSCPTAGLCVDGNQFGGVSVAKF